MMRQWDEHFANAPTPATSARHEAAVSDVTAVRMILIKDPVAMKSLVDAPHKSRNAGFSGNIATRSVSEGLVNGDSP